MTTVLTDLQQHRFSCVRHSNQ